MAQRIFDIENEKDMQDLWNIVPDNASYAKKTIDGATIYSFDGVPLYYSCELIKINWHDKTEITRPIQEATEQDVGKICAFWNNEDIYYGMLGVIRTYQGTIYYVLETHLYEDAEYLHCRRLTKQEIEEIC